MVPFLEKTSSYLSDLGKVLKTLPPSERGLVRQGLSSVYGRHNSSMHSQKKTRSPRSESRSVPFITEENGKLLPGSYFSTSQTRSFGVTSSGDNTFFVSTGVLSYFSDGLLPLLRAYYKNVQQPMFGGRETTCGIATALIVN
jgi:hypothetical protein